MRVHATSPALTHNNQITGLKKLLVCDPHSATACLLDIAMRTDLPIYDGIYNNHITGPTIIINKTTRNSSTSGQRNRQLEGGRFRRRPRRGTGTGPAFSPAQIGGRLTGPSPTVADNLGRHGGCCCCCTNTNSVKLAIKP